ncbi:hypothetical protein AGMMS4952_25420 [Spirochaetia bacterium]|nr:hypothetical protein AGMMS4952_25420 [Spirochaetia bacterium]
MALLLFWLKIAVKEIINLFKTSPIVIIGAMIIIFAFIVGGQDTVITVNQEIFIAIVSILFFIGLVVSIKKYDTIPTLTLYAKSNNTNRRIYNTFFLKQSLINNAPLLVFDFIVLKGIVKTDYALCLPIVTVVSIVCLSVLMRVRHKQGSNKIITAGNNSRHINPRIKSALSDYCTPGFIQEALLSIAFFIIVVVHEKEYQPPFFMGLLLVLALGFMGVLDSIPHINWPFYAIVSSKKFRYYYRRTFLFLTGFFCLLIGSFICLVLLYDPHSVIKYCYIILALLSFAINVSLSTGSMLIKCFTMVIVTFLTLWICSLNAYLLLLLIIPLGITYLKAKNEHGDRYLL